MTAASSRVLASYVLKLVLPLGVAMMKTGYELCVLRPYGVGSRCLLALGTVVWVVVRYLVTDELLETGNVYEHQECDMRDEMAGAAKRR